MLNIRFLIIAAVCANIILCGVKCQWLALCAWIACLVAHIEIFVYQFKQDGEQ